MQPSASHMPNQPYTIDPGLSDDDFDRLWKADDTPKHWQGRQVTMREASNLR